MKVAEIKQGIWTAEIVLIHGEKSMGCTGLARWLDAGW